MSEPEKYLAVVALNDIPRGICNDFNVEEGWVQYLIPTSGNYEDYSDPEAKFEMRRFYGKVEVLGYHDLEAPMETEQFKFMKYYDAIPEGTPHFPSEPYDVIPNPPVTIE
jgi:hypothetical protein